MRELPRDKAPDEKVAHDLVQCFTPLEFCKPFVDLQTQLKAMRNGDGAAKAGVPTQGDWQIHPENAGCGREPQTDPYQ
jgi:hypothetical protein